MSSEKIKITTNARQKIILLCNTNVGKSVIFGLLTGKYLYKFIVNGKLIKDPQNPKSKPDGYGGESFILELIE